MEINKKIVLNIVIGLIFLLTGCVSEEGPVFTEIDIVEISFASDIQPIFNDNCIVCHNQSHITGLDLRSGSSYNLLVDVSTAFYAPNLRISPFSLDDSVLWHKINDDGLFGGIMPQIGGPLSNFEIEKIKAWIEEGALDN